MQKYEVLGKIGGGTHGIVFKGKSRVTNEIVALKQFYIDEEFGIPASALREICVLKQLCHPNVIRLLDLMYNAGNTTGSGNSLSLVLVYEHCDQDLKSFCDSVTACGKIIEPAIIRLNVLL